MSLRKRLYDILDPGHHEGFLSRAANWLIYSLIFLNVVAIVVESLPAVAAQCSTMFWRFEALTVAVFSLEYVLRLWTCVESPRFASPVRGRLKYALSPLAVVDLLAILPFYVPYVSADMLFLRAVRFFRLFRVVKLGRYSAALRLVGQVVYAKRAELLTAVFVLLMLTVLSAIAMYYVEKDAQPQVFSDIPSSMFWAVATLTNVGHADPVTPLGKCLASVIFILGLGMFALPTGILGSGFVEEFQSRQRPSLRCPHCGREIRFKPNGTAQEERGT